MQIDVLRKQITLKLVYYGPGLSGKTTNLQHLHSRIKRAAKGNLMSLETKDDRTIFFDLLPVSFVSGRGVGIKLKLFTVPGQVIHNATRRIVLQAADGVGFIADSQIAEIENNAESFLNLSENLKFNGLDMKDLPLVIQFNKRDLPNIRSDEEIDRLTSVGQEPVVKAVATKGKGVIETFTALLGLTWNTLETRHKLRQRFDIDPEEILKHFEGIFESK
ncbi:MAG: gliding motility protein [Pseudomonadota bacterium]